MYGVTPGVEGAQEYYDSIVSLYADWGVDFIKCDDICRMDADSSKEETDRDTGIILFLSISDGSTAKKTEKKSVCHQRGYPETGSAA